MLTGYQLSKIWFDFCFENPDLINPNHTALYFFAVEHNNRLGWKLKFGLPSEMAKEAIGIRSYKTYIKAFNDLETWGFFKVIQRSQNQYSSNIITLEINESALVKNTKALTKATAKHVPKHIPKHVQSTYQSKYTIDKLITNNIERGETSSPPSNLDRETTIKKMQERSDNFYKSLVPFANAYPKEMLRAFYNYWSEPNKSGTKMKFELERTWSLNLRLSNWANRENTFNKSSQIQNNEPTTKRVRQSEINKATTDADGIR